MASELEIKETILIEARQITGNVGQVDPSPRWKPATRFIYYGTVTPMTEHGEVVREQSIVDGAIEIRQPGIAGNTKIAYLVLKVDHPVTLAFSQSGAKTLTVDKMIIMDFSTSSYITAATILATVNGTQVRAYWAAYS